MIKSKFRAWDKTLKKFWDADLYIDSEGAVHQMASNEAERWLEATDNFIIVWFIGRTDRNGRELYQGDIVHNHYYNMRFQISWNNDDSPPSFQLEELWRPEEKKGFEFREEKEWWELEYVGNVLDNPELRESVLSDA